MIVQLSFCTRRPVFDGVDSEHRVARVARRDRSSQLFASLCCTILGFR
jgi:hypothetical protein